MHEAINAWKSSQSPLLYSKVTTILDVFRSPSLDVEKTQEIFEVCIDVNKTHYAMRCCFNIEIKFPFWSKDDIKKMQSLMNKKGWTIGVGAIMCRDILYDKKRVIGKESETIFDAIYREIKKCCCYKEAYNRTSELYSSDSGKAGESTVEAFILRMHGEYDKAQKGISFKTIDSMKSLRTKLEAEGFRDIL